MKKTTLFLVVFAILAIVFGSYSTAEALTEPYPYQAGCQSGFLYSPVNGMPCPSDTDRPAGCLEGYLFSPITGAKCPSMPTPVPAYPVSQIVIEGVSGPQKLEVNQKGTWKVKAYDQYGRDLSYSVKWGDEPVSVSAFDGYAGMSAVAVQQSATFTHTYKQAGIYNPTFKVYSEYGGDSESTSLSVNVGNTNPGSYPGFYMETDKSSYRIDEKLSLKISRADGKTESFPVDLYAMDSRTDARILIQSRLYAGLNTTKTIKLNEWNIFTSGGAGQYVLVLCSAGEECGNGNTNSVGFILGPGAGPLKIACPSFPCFFDGKAITNGWSSVDTPPSYVSAQYPYEFTLKSPTSVKMTLRSNVWPDNPNGKNTIFVELDNKVVFKESKSSAKANEDENSDNTTDVIQLGKLSAGRHYLKIYASPDAEHFHFDWFRLDHADSSSSITVLSPNGGETWKIGGTQKVLWEDKSGGTTCPYPTNSSDLVVCTSPTYNITLEGKGSCSGDVCTLGFASYTLAQYASAPFYWSVGYDVKGNKIPAGSYDLTVCRAGSSVCDRSNNPFKIIDSTSGPSLFLTASVNGAVSGSSEVSMKAGDTITFSGTPKNLKGPNYFTDYTMAWFFDPVFNGACNKAENNGIKTWYLTCTPTTSGTSKTYAEIYQDGQTYRSNIINVTVGKTSSSYIMVLSPNGGETWPKGTTQTIKWQYTGPVPSCMPDLPCIYPFKYDIYLYNDTYGDNLIAGNVSGSYYKWSVWPFRSDSEKVKIKVCLAGSRTNCDSSDSYFKITSEVSTAPSITVMSPNGGETYALGDNLKYSVKYSSKTVGNVYHYLTSRKDPDADRQMMSGAQGYQPWSTDASGTIILDDNNIIPGSYYWLSTWQNTDGTGYTYDFSDAPFRITSGTTTTPVIKVLSPNGGETLTPGTMYTVTVYANATGITDPTVKLQVLHNGVVKGSFVQYYLNSNGPSASWPVGKYYDSNNNFVDATPGTGYQIQAVLLDGNTAKAYANSGMFTISSSSSALSASCTATPISDADGYVLKWDAKVSGGTSPYKYSWSVYNDVAAYTGGSTSSQSFTARYSSTGTKEAVARVADYAGKEASANCSGTIPSSQPATLHVERHSASPSGYINYGSNVEILRAVLKPAGRDATIKKLTFDVVGSAVPFVSNMKVYADGVAIGTLTNLRNTWSSVHYTADSNIDWEIEADDSAEISVRGDISSAGINQYMWVNLTAIGTDPVISSSSISSLPVSGHQVNFSPILPSINPAGSVQGAQSFTFTQKLEFGMEGSEVRELQKYLAAKGYYSGDIDGKFGLKTEKALVSFQITNGLKVDGIVGAAVRDILNR